MRKPSRLLGAIASTPIFAATVCSAFTIQFDFTYDSSNFFDVGTDARNRLEDAGAFFEGIIADDFDPISPSGGNSWNIQFSNPSTNAPPTTISNPTIPADTIIVYVGARDLGGATLGEAGPGGWNGTGTAGWFDTIRQRGEVGSTQSPGATDFAPWGGSLSMDSDSIWDYSVDGSTLDPGENHFYSVLVHEMAHVLGWGSSDSWDDYSVGGFFTGPASVAEYGANVPLEPGDGHWAEGTMSTVFGTGVPQETAMDPTLIVGTAKFWTDLDSAGLTDIGWEIVPEPSTGLLSLLGLLVLVVRRRR